MTTAYRTRPPRRIATRNGEPAYVNAPPRLRASQIERPQPLAESKPRWWPFNRKD